MPNDEQNALDALRGTGKTVSLDSDICYFITRKSYNFVIASCFMIFMAHHTYTFIIWQIIIIHNVCL